MSPGAEIYLAALRAGVLLEKADGGLRVRSLAGPVSPDLRGLLQASKDEVLAFLDWRERALATLFAAMERLDHGYDCARLDTADIDDAEARITASFWTQDERVFTAAVRDWRLAVWRADTQRREDGS